MTREGLKPIKDINANKRVLGMAYMIYNRAGVEVGAFIHIPRTGGTFVRHVLHRFGYRTIMAGKAHQPLAVIPTTTPFTFTFIRHPLLWYPSMFAYRQQHGWPSTDSFPWSRHFKSRTLLGFIKNVIACFPNGYYNHLLDRATAEYDRRGLLIRRINHIGYSGKLAENIAAVLVHLGQKKDHSAMIASMTPLNESTRVTVDNASAELIYRYEHEVISRWWGW